MGVSLLTAEVDRLVSEAGSGLAADGSYSVLTMIIGTKVFFVYRSFIHKLFYQMF